MKFIVEGKQQHKRSYALVTIGLLCITLAATIIIIDPLNMIVDYKLGMRPGSLIFEMWEKPPLELYIKVHIFNITNADRFLAGLDKKIKVVEAGPYVYKEILENHNATFNYHNNTIGFRPVRKVEFVREKSFGDPHTDIIVAPNIPYLAVTTLASKVSPMVAMGFRTLMTTMNSDIFLNLTVQDYLWGYDDPLVRLASRWLPHLIHFNTFGLLDRFFDEGENWVTMNLPRKQSNRQDEKNSMPIAERQIMGINELDEEKAKQSFTDLFKEMISSKLYNENSDKPSFVPKIRDYSIDTWNGNAGLAYWGYREGKTGNTECNTLRGTYDGTLFPRNIEKGEIFRIYRKTFCRTLPIEYTHPGKMDGIDAYFFKLSDNAFDTDLDDPTSSCFCTDNICLKKGLGNISPCYWNIPAAISFPHFFNADPSLVSDVEGLNPSEEKHGSTIVLQPQLGVPMKVTSRFQLNLLMGDVKFNTKVKKFQNTALPIVWIEIGVSELPGHLVFLLQLLFNYAPYIQGGIIVLLILGGISIMGFAALLFFCIPRPIATEFLPKTDPKYSAIYMFPYIRKEMGKVREEEESCLPSSPNMNILK